MEKSDIKTSVTTAVGVVVVLFLCLACSNKPEMSSDVVNRTEAPRLRADEITTLVSDSGITRYRITTKTWLVFDKTEEPYWDFPDGLHLESFDEQFQVTSRLDCRRARYYEQRKLWQLDDSVRAMNVNGDHFATQQLFWNQTSERVYSDSLITIDQNDKRIVGEGFESNQEMTRYTIRKTRGIIPISTEE